MRKLNVLLLVLGIAIILTGCDLFGSDESINAQNDIVVINFDSHSEKGMSLNTQYPKVAELYWSYTAEKKDNKPKYGEKLAPANIKDGTGCDKNIEFSTGKWEFVLYGFTTADARTKSNTVELAEKNCTYTGKVEKELKKTDTAVTVCTEVNSNSDTYGTISVSVTTSPTNSNKTVKYYITNANGYSTTWTSVPGQENTSATDGYTVYLGLFDENSKNVGETSITNIRVDAGLTTEISGTWDVSFIEGGIDIIGPWNVKFESILGKSIQNQSVKNGECAKKPADLTEGEQIRGIINGTDAIYKFAGWAETENAPVVDIVNIEAIQITADKTFYAVWSYVSDAPNVWNVKFETRIPNHVIPNQLVENGKYAVTPSDFKVGDKVSFITGSIHYFYFWGWSTTITDITEGSLADKTVDVDTIPITTDTTFYAVWGESHTDSKTLLFIDVTVFPIGYVFSEGDVVKEHLIVKGLYSDGLENTITDTDYSTDITTVTSKTNEVTVTYTENSVTKTKTIPISVSGSLGTLERIEIFSLPKTTYYENEEFDVSGLVIVGVYSDSSKRVITDYTLSIPNGTNVGNVVDGKDHTTQTNIVTYNGDSSIKTSFDITVEKIPSYTMKKGTEWFSTSTDLRSNITKIVFDYTDNLPQHIKNKINTQIQISLGDTENDLVYLIEDGTELYIFSYGTICGNSDCTEMFKSFNNSNLKEITFNNFNTTTITDMSYMFKDCSYLEKLDVSKWDTANVTYMNDMFKNCQKLKTLDVSNWNTFNVTDMSYMFHYCKTLETLDVRNWKTSNVTDMSFMFNGCNILTSLNPRKFDTSNVTKMNSMFYGCEKLTSLDLSNFDTSKVTDMSIMFNNCLKLETLNLSNFDTSNVTNMGNMFGYCSQLTTLDLSSFDTSNVIYMDNMFNNCGHIGTIVTINPNQKDKFDTVLSGWTYDGVNTYTKMSLIDIEVITKTDVFFEGENIKDFLTVKSVYSDGSKKTLSDTDYNISPSEIVYSTNTSLEISYEENGVTKTKSINITLGNLSDYKIDNSWFDNFSGVVNKESITSISFVKEKPSDVTELVKTVGQLSFYKKDNDLYVVGRKLIFDTDCSEMFKDFSNVKTIDLSEVDTSKVTDMGSMFNRCKKLTDLDLSSFDTSNVTDMISMFSFCEELTSITFGDKFDTSKVENMSYMFYGCEKQKTLDISGFIVSDTPLMSDMFHNFGKEGTTVTINPTYKSFFNGTDLGNTDDWTYDGVNTYTKD